jgi:hypothetical protein
MAAKKKTAHTFKVGDLFTVVSSAGGHGYPVGQKYEVTAVSAPYVQGKNVVTGTVPNVNWVATNDIKLVENDLKGLEAEKADLEAQLAVVESKIQFVKDNGLEEYDEKTFKIYQALSVIETTDDKLEKAKKLAELVKDLS